MIQISTTIKNLRQQQGITQEALAWQLGVTPQAVSRWEATEEKGGQRKK